MPIVGHGAVDRDRGGTDQFQTWGGAWGLYGKTLSHQKPAGGIAFKRRGLAAESDEASWFMYEWNGNGQCN